MRMRNEQLKTGKALAWIDGTEKSKSRVLLFLVQGADDIALLDALQDACRARIESHSYGGFSWHAVADPGQISLVDRRLFSADIHRFEVCEFQSLNGEQLACLLSPIIDHLAAGDSELLPRVGGAVGGPAEGIQFLDRSSEVQHLITAIREGRSMFLQAPRRMGKTSLMRRVKGELEGEFTTVSLNLERDPSPAECAARLRSMVTGEGFHTALKAARQDPPTVVGQSVQALCSRSEKPVVLFVDELVALFEGIKLQDRGEEDRRSQALRFLLSLAEPPNANAARLVVAGSVNWQTYLEAELQVTQDELPSFFSGLEKVVVHPLDMAHPECELRALLLGSGLVAEPADMQWLLENVDLALPFPAMKLLDSVLAETKQQQRIDPSALDELLRDFLMTTDSFADFDAHLRSKCPVPGAVERVSEALTAIAFPPFELGVSEAAVSTALSGGDGGDAHRLEAWFFDTFPVKAEGGRTRFVPRLFRQWWRSQIAKESVKND